MLPVEPRVLTSEHQTVDTTTSTVSSTCISSIIPLSLENKQVPVNLLNEDLISKLKKTYNFPISVNLPSYLAAQSESPALPEPLQRHPTQWNREDVQQWLKWCVDQFQLPSNLLDSIQFSMNGRGLLVLTKEDFAQRVPGHGDILYNSLQNLLVVQSNRPVYHYNPYPSILVDSLRQLPSVSSSLSIKPTMDRDSGVGESPTDTDYCSRSSPTLDPCSVDTTRWTESWAPTYTSSHPRTSVKMHNGYTTDQSHKYSQAEPKHSPHAQNNGSKPPYRPIMASTANFCLLWDFLRKILRENKYPECIEWVDKDQYIFKITNPEGLARMWGAQKNRVNMTYEKMSRALRYYYRSGIMQKVPQRKLMYQFLVNPEDIPRMPRGVKLELNTRIDTEAQNQISPKPLTNGSKPLSGADGLAKPMNSPMQTHNRGPIARDWPLQIDPVGFGLTEEDSDYSGHNSPLLGEEGPSAMDLSLNGIKKRKLDSVSDDEAIDMRTHSPLDLKMDGWMTDTKRKR